MDIMIGTQPVVIWLVSLLARLVGIRQVVIWRADIVQLNVTLLPTYLPTQSDLFLVPFCKPSLDQRGT